MQDSFEETLSWYVSGAFLPGVKVKVKVEPLESEFVLRYRNKVTWKAACPLNGSWEVFPDPKTFATNSNTREEILSEIKERLGAL